MTADDWSELERLLRESAARSSAVKRALQRFAFWLNAALEGPRPEAEPALGPLLAPASQQPERPTVPAPLAAEQLARAWSQGFAREARVRPSEAEPTAAPKPAALAPRMRLKAEACRWAVQRRSLELRAGSDALATGRRNEELRRRARGLGWLELWMLSRDLDLPDDGVLHMLAAGFDNLGHALEIAAELDEVEWREPDTLGCVLAEAAECQSALRALLRSHHLPEDPDQNGAFEWLRETTDQFSVYLPRHMRLDDPADPTSWEARGARLAALQQGLGEARERRRAERDARGKLAYHVKRILNSAVAVHGGELALDEWRRVYASVEALLELGVKPSDVRLREELLPLVEQRPLELEPPPAWECVVEEIDRALALKELDENPAPATRERPPSVRRVAELLRGKRVVMIGGVRRPASHAALLEAFELGELEWISTREHESAENFRAAVERADTALVLLLIRWSSHSFKAVKSMADGRGKPFVYLPRGYNPAQVAEEILKQAGA